MPVTIARSPAPRMLRVHAGVVLAVMLPALAAAQTTYTVSSEAALRAALASAVAGDTIAFAGNITLTADLPSVGSSVTIDGGGYSLSGNNQFRGLFVAAFEIPLVGGPPAPAAIAVTIQNLTIRDTVATGGSGGAGGAGGGGGAGMGGALFIGDLATVSVSKVSLISNAAVGGLGGTVGAGDNGGGGGGLGGSGAAADAVNGAGGGGGIGIGADGGGPGGPGLPGIITGLAQGAGGGAGSAGQIPAYGGGVPTLSTQAGFGGGGGGSSGFGGTSLGGFGGGGGGTGLSVSPGFGSGGYGGGGGGATASASINFGGTFGGDGGTLAAPGGGGGAGLGGAIFVQAGGNLTIGGDFTINGAAVTGGAGSASGLNGSAAGSGIFFQGSGFYSLSFAPAGSQVATVSGDIADEFGVLGRGGALGVSMDGTGTLVLSGNNLFSGGTNLSAGTLSVSSDTNLGLAGTSLYGNGGTTLRITGSGTFSRDLYVLAGTQTLSIAPGQTANWSGVIGSESPAAINVTGGGALFLSNPGNWYALGTSVNGNTRLIVADDGALGATGGALILGDAASGGTLALDAPSFLSSRSITLQTGGGTIDTIGSTDAALAGTIDGAGSLAKNGTGLLTLTGNNTYGGATIVNAGTLRAGSGTAFGSSTSLVAGAGGTADFNGFNQAFYSVGGTGVVALNGAATLTVGGDNSSSSFGGTFTGTGGLIKAGTGAWTLSGANTFGGGLALTSGTVNVAADANLGGAGAIRMSNATTLGLTGSGTFTHTLLLAGTSSVNVGAGQSVTWSGLVGDNAGAGTLRLTGGGLFLLTNTANSYTGGTVVTGGSTLQVSADGVLGATSGGLTLGDAGTAARLGIAAAGTFLSPRAITLGALGATVDTSSTTAATLSGVISGTGGLTKTGTGQLTLSGANTFTGGITVLGGSLWGTSSSLRGSIFSNTQIVFDQATDGTYSGVLRGGGALVKTGTGALTLSGANTYTGGTFLNGGSIIGTTNSLQGTIIDNGELVFNQAFDGTFRGIITGFGGLTKLGVGTVSLSGAQGYTGLTWIREGTLATDTRLPGSVRVDSAGTLWAAGVIGGSVDLAGTLLIPAPGTQFARFVSPLADQNLTAGTQSPSLLIEGNLTTTAGSTIGLSLSSGGPVPLLVNGTANLTGTHFTVNVDAPPPARISSFLAISTTGGLHMTGGDVSSPSTTLLPVLRPGPFALMVTLLNAALPLGAAARTPNAIQVGRAVDAGRPGATGDFANVVRELTALDDEALDRALRGLGGEIHASTARLVALDGLSVTDMVRNELSSVEHDWKDSSRPAGGPLKPRFWVQLSGDHASFTSGTFSGGTANVGGGGGGLDIRPGSRWTVGAGLALSRGGLSLRDLSETSTMTAPRAFTYYGFSFGPFNVHWGGSVSRSTTTTKRHIQFAAFVPDANGQLVPLSAGIDREASSDQVSTARDAWSDWQFTRKFGTWTFDGKLGLRFASYTRNEFAEGGADSISLDVHRQALSTREFNIDVHHFRRTGTWRPNILLTYRREFGDDWTRAKANFAGNPITQFSVQGMPVPKDTFQGLLGITMRSRGGLLYTLDYQFLHSSDESRHSVRFKVRF